MKIERWLMHSPYPDGTWRGIEKCAGFTVVGDLSLFPSKTDAVRNSVEQMRVGMVPVRVVLEIPDVRHSLDSVGPDDFSPLINADDEDDGGA